MDSCRHPPSHAPFLRGETYSAYWTTPFFPSWLANGTLVGMPFFMGGGAPGPSEMRAGFCIVVALLFDEFEIHAAETARKGVMAVEGLAVQAAQALALVFWGLTDRRWRAEMRASRGRAKALEDGQAGVGARLAYRAAPLRRRTWSSTAWRRWVSGTTKGKGGVERWTRWERVADGVALAAGRCR